MKLRPYQREIAKHILDSIQENLGLTFSVEIARQVGKPRGGQEGRGFLSF
jgi:hypothetical protein